jgi:hypothetical protein
LPRKSLMHHEAITGPDKSFRVLQIVCMSFVAHEERLRRRAVKEQKEVDAMRVVVSKMRDEEAAQQV